MRFEDEVFFEWVAMPKRSKALWILNDFIRYIYVLIKEYNGYFRFSDLRNLERESFMTFESDSVEH